MDLTLIDMNRLGLNINTAEEINSIENGESLAIDAISLYVETLRYPDGRKVRSERRKTIVQVYSVLLKFLNLDKKSILYGQCSPSMLTIAKEIYPELKEMKPGKTKDKFIFRAMMTVQRTIKVLALFGLIKIHEYRAKNNRNDNPDSPNLKHPNFYYEIVQVTMFSSLFNELIKASKAVKKGVKTVVLYLHDTLDKSKKICVKTTKRIAEAIERLTPMLI